MREESKTKRRSCVEINENKKNLEFNKHGRVVVTINKSHKRRKNVKRNMRIWIEDCKG